MVGAGRDARDMCKAEGPREEVGMDVGETLKKRWLKLSGKTEGFGVYYKKGPPGHL